MNLGFDLDEVIAQTGKMVFSKFNERNNSDLTHEALTSFYFDENTFSEDEAEQEKIVNELLDILFSDDYILDIEPYEEAVKALSTLKRQGHDIFIVTKRHTKTKDLTLEWLRAHKVPCTKLVLTGLEEKGAAARRYKLDGFVDDLAENLIDLHKTKMRWHKGLMLMTRPWNCNDYIDTSKYTRVSNWGEVLRRIHIGNRLRK